MGRGVFQFKSFWDTAHVQMMYPLPNPRISYTDARLFMNMVQIRLKSQDSRIQGFQLDLKIVYEFQLRELDKPRNTDIPSTYKRKTNLSIVIWFSSSPVLSNRLSKDIGGKMTMVADKNIK